MVVKGAVAGVVLESGDEIRSNLVVSGADPRRTLLALIDPVELDPDFVLKIRNYRCQGTTAKVNLALDALPDFRGLAKMPPNEAGRHLSGRIHIGPGIDYLERAFDAAKYGEFSPNPYLDITIPSLSDPTLAPAGRHVLSIVSQYAPFKLRHGTWNEARDALGATVVRTLSEYAPGIDRLIIHRQVITPQDLEDEYGLTGGHIFHGEHSLDQVFSMRPLLGWARYRTPIDGLYLCGAGTHPGGGITGAPGANAAREVIKDTRRRR
jgi:phytoene dehydrogenase-like protein